MNKRIALISGLTLALALTLAALLMMGPARAAESSPPTANPIQPDQLRQSLDRIPALAGGDQLANEPDAFFYGQWELAADSPFQITRFDAEYSLETGKAYVLGGRLADNSTSGRVWEFDPVTGVYTDTGTDMPVPISNYVIARLNESDGDEVLVIFGGRPDAGGVVDTVQGYYPGTNTTVLFASDPYPVATSPGSAVAHNNLAYVMGGFDGSAMIDDTYIFDITASPGSRWTTGPNLSVARSYIGATVVDGYVYAMGGDGFDGAALIPLTITERLSTANPVAWNDAAVAEMPLACEEAPVFGFDSASPYDLAGAVVVAGCGQWPEEINEVLLYDVANDTWDVDFPNLNETRRNHAGAFVPTGDGGNGKPGMWLWGGIQGDDSNVLDVVEYYDVTPLGAFTLLPRDQTVIASVGWTPVTVGAVNRSGGDETFDLAYAGSIPTWTVSGPPSVFVNDSDDITFTFQVSVPVDAACFAFTDVSITGTGQVSAALSDTVNARVQSGGAWTPVTNTVTGGHWMAYACTDLYGAAGTCFYFGGLQGSGSQGVTGLTRIYDVASGAWTVGAPLPTPVFAGVSGVISTSGGVRVYVAGGFDGDDFSSVTDALQIYDPATDSWSAGPPMPLARGGVGGGAVGDKLYVTGGQDTTYAYAHLHEYDPAANAWYTRTSHVTVASSYFPVFFGYATTADKLYIGGDYFGDTTFLEYNPATDAWVQRADLPTTAGQKSPVGAGVGDQVFWFGGNTDEWNNTQDTTWLWDPIRNQWALSYATMNTPATGSGGGYANGQLWTFGGSQGSGSLEPPPHETAPPCAPPFPPVGAFQGAVLDANTGLGVPDAYLYTEVITDDEIYAETFADAAGNYQFSGLQLSTYKLIASAKGYRFTYLDDPANWLTVPALLPDGLITYNVTLSAPVMGWSETAFTEVLESGERVTRTLIVSNAGTSDLLFSLGSYTQDILPPPPPNALDANRARVDPKLLSELAAAPDAKTDIVIVMGEQADLSAAYEISDWDARGEYVYNTLIETAERSQVGVRASLADRSVAFRPFLSINGLLVRGDRSLVDTLAARSDVAYLLANDEIVLETQRPGLFARLSSLLRAPLAVEWGVLRVNADDVWSTYGVHGEGIVVANIDTGVDWTHSALVNQYRGGAGDHDFNWYMPTFGCDDSSGPCDNDGHGTHTMGTMVGDDGASNQIGVAPGSSWIACKGCEINTCSFEALLGCADWVLAPCPVGAAPGDPSCDPTQRPHVVNNSWGGGGGDFWYGGAVGAWRASGIFPQFSGGNSGPGCSTTGAPGDYWMSYAAAAIDSGDQAASFSSRGPAAITGILKPDISAPGVNIRSSFPGETYGAISGTSMASPHVAGVVALTWSAMPELVGQIEDTMWLLSQTADPLYTTDTCGGDTPASYPNHTYGWGMVDAYAAISTGMAGEIAPSWVTLDPMGGTVPPGESATVDVVFDAPAFSGTYTGALQLTADEPYNPDVRLPLTVTVFAPAQASFGSNTPVAPDGTAVFTNTTLGSEPISYLWNFGDGSAGLTTGGVTSTLESPTHTYALPGTYTVTLYASNAYGDDTATGVVDQLGGPVASFDSSSPDLLGQTTSFTDTTHANPGVTVWLWQFETGQLSTDPNPTYAFASTGLYSVSLTVVNVYDTDEYEGEVAICSAFVDGANFSTDPTVPEAGQTVTFQGSVAAGDEFAERPVQFAWDFGDGGVASGDSPTHVFAAGTYTVTLTASGPCGADTYSELLNIPAGAPEFFVFLPVVLK